MYRLYLTGKLFLQRLDPGVFLALLLAIPLIVPFLHPGLPATADGEIHLHRMISAAVDMSAGYLYPRWSPYLHQGFGYPIHNFYVPGVHIVGALIYMATHIAAVDVIKLMQIAATLLYPLGAYLFARKFASRPAALVAAAAYTFAPMRFHELWTQTNLSQYTAMALIPFLFAALLPDQHHATRRTAKIGLLFAAIILAHHPTGFITAAAAGGYALIVGWRSPRNWLIGLGGLALGLGIASIFWLPALAELQFTQISRAQEGAFSVIANFVPLASLISPIPIVDLARVNTPRFLAVGTAQIVLVLLSLLALLRRKIAPAVRLQVALGAGMLAICIFFITPASERLWLTLPIANLIVFPWRLLGIAALAALPGAAVVIDQVAAKWRTAAAALVIGALFAFALPMLYAPLQFYTPRPATPAGAILYEQETGNVGLTSANEYLPKWVEQRPLSGSPSDYETFAWYVGIWDKTLPAGVTVSTQTNCDRGSSCFDVNAPQPFTLDFKQMYFPGWDVIVDNQSVEPYPHGENGLLAADLPAGQHSVRIRYGGTPIQHVGDALALLSLAICAVLIAQSLRRTKRQPQPAPQQFQVRLWALLPLAVVLLWIGYDTFAAAPYASQFVQRSAPDAPPAQHLVSENFGGMVELVGYDLDRITLAPGDMLRVTLYWRRIGAIDRPLRAAVKLTDVDATREWGGAQSINLAGSDVRGWSTDQYGVDTFLVPVSQDAPPFVGQVRVLVFSDETGLQYLPLVGSSSSDAILTTVRVTGDLRRFDDLTPLNIQFGDALTLEGYALTYPDARSACIRLRWHVQQPPANNNTVMLHLLDAAGTELAVADVPPFGGLYATSNWAAGQTLEDEQCFALPDGAAQVMFGLYDSTTLQRPPLTANDVPPALTIQNDALYLPFPPKPAP